MPASRVCGYLNAGLAAMSTLQVKWFVSNPDRHHGEGCYSTAYRMGEGCKWEIHCHRDAKRKTWTATVQNTSSIGNTNATRSNELHDADKKLALIGVPALHYPTSTKNKWSDM